MAANVHRQGSGDKSIQWFGRHFVRIEEPDIFHIRCSGAVTAEELRGILDYQVAWGTGNNGYYVLCDLTDLGAVYPEARRTMNEGMAEAGVRLASICFGATF